ncbi:MAG TPA: serine/threonine-protein kinase, partial [Polyangia bacterium]|nr:serine/threonine-protein kinase [Polyangia bacterium]
MSVCPRCLTQYPAGVEVCARDGATLTPSVVGSAADLVTAPTMPDLPAASAAPTAPAAPSASATPAASTPAAGPATQSEASVSAAIAAAPAPSGADPNFDSLIGATLAGRYEILRRIGEGGMGAVYEARHTVIGKRVAVKVLLEKFLTKSDFVARLLQEARLASSIGHENIVDVTDFGTTDDGRSFVVMEFLDGEALSQLVMREAPLPVERSLRIARQVASALGAAHAKGIYHRDVKPENVYLVRRGEADFVKVVDFGISKAVKQGGNEEGAEVYRLTHTGLLLGTPLYMSPEQARGDEDLDHRVDIWALGIMMYECLTGEVPFRANNYLGIISQVLTHTAAPPSQVRPELGIPDAVEAVVMRAMEKDRTRRYAAMADLEHDLERLLAGDQNVGSPLVIDGSVGARRGSAVPPRRWHLGLAAALALGIGVSLALSRPPGGDMKPPSAKISTTTPKAPAMPAPAAPRSADAPPPVSH